MMWQRKPSPTYVVELVSVNDSGTDLVKPYGDLGTGLVLNSKQTTGVRVTRQKRPGLPDSFGFIRFDIPL